MKRTFNRRIATLVSIIALLTMTVAVRPLNATTSFALQDGQGWTPKSGGVKSNAGGGTTTTKVEQNGSGATRTTTTVTDKNGNVIKRSQEVDNGDGTGESTSTETADGVTKTTTEKHSKDKTEKETTESAGGQVRKVTRETSVRGVNGWSTLISETFYKDGKPVRRVTYSSFPDGKSYHSEVDLTQPAAPDNKGSMIPGGRAPSLAGARVVMTGRVVQDAPATLGVVDTRGQTLSGVVVTVGNREVTTDQSGQATINVDASSIDHPNGTPVLIATIAGTAATATALVLPRSTDNNVPLSIQHAPAVITQGSELPVSGTGIDPIAHNNVVWIDGLATPVRAASPVGLMAAVTSEVTAGQHTVKLINNNGTSECVTNVARVDLKASQTTIPIGGGAEIGATVSGLKDVPRSAYPMRLEMTNNSPAQIAFEGGSQRVTRMINFEDVSADGRFLFPMSIRALAPGAFEITATLESGETPALIADAQDDCSKLLDEANKKRAEANKKRAEAESLDKEAGVLRSPAHWENKAKALRDRASSLRKAAADKRNVKNPAAGKKEGYMEEAKKLDAEAAKADADAGEIEGLVKKHKDVKGQDRTKMAENNEKQAGNLRKQADKLEEDAKKLEKEFEKKCKD